jgi:hypothetical protein
MIHFLWLPAYRPPTLNQLMRGTLKARIRLAKECKQFVGAYARMQGTPPATGRRRVSLTIVLKGRQQEADVDAYFKSLLDALVHHGLLLSDRVEHCRLGDVTHTRLGVPGTRVYLEDLP